MTAAITTSFWDDEIADLHLAPLRRNVPPMPTVGDDFQTVSGGVEALAFLAYQISRSSDKRVIMRALASAVAILFKESANFTGSARPIEALSGVAGPIADASIAETVEVVTNFSDAEPVTKGEVLSLMSADIDELAAYFGICCLAGVKRLTTDNRTAFNDLRKESIRATVIGNLVIFVDNSPFLVDTVLNNIYAAFNSYLASRAHLISRTAGKMGGVGQGPQTAFTTMFLLLADQGMAALRIIKEGVLKHPWITTDFPELKPELEAANRAQMTLRNATASNRQFLKAIFGASFVPMAYADINNLLGVCRRVMTETVPTYANYKGGRITQAQDDYITRKLRELAVHAQTIVRAATPIIGMADD